MQGPPYGLHVCLCGPLAQGPVPNTPVRPRISNFKGEEIKEVNDLCRAAGISIRLSKNRIPSARGHNSTLPLNLLDPKPTPCNVVEPLPGTQRQYEV